MNHGFGGRLGIGRIGRIGPIGQMGEWGWAKTRAEGHRRTRTDTDGHGRGWKQDGPGMVRGSPSRVRREGHGRTECTG